MNEKNKRDIRELSLDDIQKAIESINEKSFRAQQIHDWLWLKQCRSIDEMTNLSKDLRAFLKETFEFKSIQTDHIQVSTDGTMKFRFKTFDNHFIEGVLIPTTDRLTACISSQIGCSLTCKFCATGKMERERNLSFAEIFDQVAIINKKTMDEYGRRLTNIVYMGMGEPLLNYKNVMKSIELITSPKALGMSPTRITVSTAGIAKQIKQLADENAKFNLALSLHAADNQTRSKIMPINDSNKIEELMEALDYYYKKTKLPVTYEYILFEDINDSEEDAQNLIKLCRRVPSKVNIIEYNPVAGTGFEKPTDKRFDSFIEILEQSRINVRVRRSRGKDIDAACGQLANKGEKN
ncbi:MAG: hypothetical protein RI955_700 [Bacteroidota bacterium]